MIKLDIYRDRFNESQMSLIEEMLSKQENVFRAREEALEDDIIKLKAELRLLKSKIEKAKRLKDSLAEKKRTAERNERERLFKIFSSFLKDSIKAGKIK